MKRPLSTLQLLALLIVTSLLPLFLLAMPVLFRERPAPDDRSVDLKLHVGGATEQVELLLNDDGTHSFLLHRGKDDEERLTPEQLADRIYRQETSRDWLSRFFNISGPTGFIWVSVGLLGQFLFTGRMVIQWLASEKSRQSVVPPMFWWMSLCGALMLLTYFLWRRDIVGVLGQSFGLMIYVRNLYFIRLDHSERGS